MLLAWACFVCIATTALFAQGNSMQPGDATLRHLHQDSQARCIDGSTPAYYYRKGAGDGVDKWLVYFEGGGWCYDLEQCHMRSRTAMGTSQRNSPRRPGKDLRLYVSASPQVNPMMHNWNLALVRYCDGGSFAGDSIHEYEGQTLYFKGKHNRNETIRSLFYMEDGSTASYKGHNITKDGYNMSSATEVVIAGCSAGGLGVFLGLDHMADMVRSLAAAHGNTNVTVRGLVDSGFFMNYTSDYVSHLTHLPSYGQDDAVTAKTMAIHGNRTIIDYASCMRDVFVFMNISAGTNPACLRAHQGGSPVDGFPAIANCIFAANLLPHIKTPLFLMQSQFDSWQISRVFGQKYSTEGVNDFGANFTTTVQESLLHAHNPGHGAMVDSCVHHGMNCESPWSGHHIHYTSSEQAAEVAEHMQMANSTGTISWNYANAFSAWYQRSIGMQSEVHHISGPKPDVNWFFLDHAFPCHDCCKCKT